LDKISKDLRIKLPFIVIPLVMATSDPLKKEHFYFLLYVFLGIVFYSSLYNFIRYNYFLEQQNDIREMSVFISHVRFSILINFAIFTALFLIIKKKYNPLIWLALSVWFLFYLYKSQIINGYILFIVLIAFSSVYLVTQLKSRKIRRITYLLLFSMGTIVIFSLTKFIKELAPKETIDFSMLDLYTENDRPYFHDQTNLQRENGNLIWIYVNQKELENEWNRRSEIPYDSLDRKGQPMFGTLMRYLTSKNLRKDSIAVHQLAKEEIHAIESGQTSIAVNQGLKTRLTSFLFEYEIYKNGGDPNGNSLIQRLEHLKVATRVIKKKWLFGVGIGDVPTAFSEEYNAIDSLLKAENRHRSHNQFLTIWVTLGVIGFLLFTVLFIIPFSELKQRDYFFWIVIIGLGISCFFQDLIETQAGVSIFALFYALALYRENEWIEN